MNDNIQKTTKNTLLNTYGTFVYFFFQWLTTVLVVRISGYADAGVFSIVVSFTNIFAFLSRYGIRYFQLSDNNGEFSQYQYCGTYVLMTLVSFAAFSLSVFFFGYERETVICCFAYIFFKYLETSTYYLFTLLQKRDSYVVIAVSYTLKGVIPLAGFVGALYMTKRLLFAIIAMTVLYLITVVFPDIYVLRRDHPLKFTFNEIYPLVKKCFPLMLSTLIIPYMTFVVRFVIERLYGEEQLGYYSSISMVVVIMTTLAGSVWVVILPDISEKYSSGRYAEIKKEFYFIYAGIAAVTVLAVVAGKLLGAPVFKLIFTDGILPYMYLLPPVIVSSGLLTLSAFYMAVLIPLKKRVTMLLCAAAGSAVLTVAAYPMTKAFGMQGANYALLTGLISQIIFLAIPTHLALRNKTEREDNA
ncbi:MAG: oligosaccharide flippase family protein [Clostridiales bacterium]|nr:oligosaccharide flippase family protein [Clostridiales bacterium]